jgi:hypothetical protein
MAFTTAEEDGAVDRPERVDDFDDRAAEGNAVS